MEHQGPSSSRPAGASSTIAALPDIPADAPIFGNEPTAFSAVDIQAALAPLAVLGLRVDLFTPEAINAEGMTTGAFMKAAKMILSIQDADNQDKLLAEGVRRRILTSARSASVPQFIAYMRWLRTREGQTAVRDVQRIWKLERKAGRGQTAMDVRAVQILNIQLHDMATATRRVREAHEERIARHRRAIRRIEIQQTQEVEAIRASYKPAGLYVEPDAETMNRQAYALYVADADQRRLRALPPNDQGYTVARDRFGDVVRRNHQVEFCRQEGMIEALHAYLNETKSQGLLLQKQQHMEQNPSGCRRPRRRMQLAVPANAKKRFEILVGSEGTSRENGIGSFVPRGGCSRIRTDTDNSYLPPLSDDITLLILARLPSSKCCDLCLVNRRFRSLIRSGELNEIRKNIGLKEPKVFLLSNESRYQCYEPYTRSCWDLPVCPYDKTTKYHNKILFCVGTQLLVFGIFIRGYTGIWRYELELNQWFNGPMMITPRYLFAFADCGSVACVAGGVQQVSKKALNSAEKYNPESKSWEPLPNMIKRRRFCLGFYMDSKFYVVSGQNENRDLLTCGECYDFERNVWELIPNMIEYHSVGGIVNSQPSYLMTVVNNELYFLEFSSRHLKVYLKNNNTWKKVGRMPASIERLGGWIVALKSLGNELLLIGRIRIPVNRSTPENVVLCFCTPSPKLDDVEWHVLDFNRPGRNQSISNCSVMML